MALLPNTAPIAGNPPCSLSHQSDLLLPSSLTTLEQSH